MQTFWQLDSYPSFSSNSINLSLSRRSRRARTSGCPSRRARPLRRRPRCPSATSGSRSIVHLFVRVIYFFFFVILCLGCNSTIRRISTKYQSPVRFQAMSDCGNPTADPRVLPGTGTDPRSHFTRASTK